MEDVLAVYARPYNIGNLRKPHLARFSRPDIPLNPVISGRENRLEVGFRRLPIDYPVVCMDEKPFQLTDERHEPILMSKANSKLRYDCEYERMGTCSIFIFTEPLSGWRDAHALPQRRKIDWAHKVKWLLDEQYSKRTSKS